MELQFNKTVIPCLRTVLQDTQSQEQTQEIRLPDGMPDIGKVLSSWGQVVIRGKEWHSGGINVSGGVMAWVLYLPEDGTQPRCVESWLPFQMKWEFREPENDGFICVQPLLRGVDSRSTSARKLMVRSVVSLLAEAMASADGEVCSPGELPEDICLLNNTYPVQLPVEAGEKAFTLEDTVTLPDSQPPIQKLIRCQLQAELTEQKILADKLVFRGEALLHILYCATDEKLYSWDFSIPFSQFGELDREHGPDSVAKVCFAVTNLEVEQGEAGVLSFKAGLTGQYVVYDSQSVQLVEDAYSPHRQVKPQSVRLQLPAVLDNTVKTVSAEQTVEANAAAVADVAFYPDHPRQYSREDGVAADLTGTFQVLYYDEEGLLRSSSSRWEGDWSLDASGQARIEAGAAPSGISRATLSGMNIRLQGNVQVDAMSWADEGLSMVTGLELGEINEPDPNRPSLILCRAGEESLWELAKRTGSTVQAIQKANGLEAEPMDDRFLLIPVC